MATAVATATRPGPSKDVLVAIPRALLERMGGPERFREYLDRVDVETDFLERNGGGEHQSLLGVNSQARGGGVNKISTAPRREV